MCHRLTCEITQVDTHYTDTSTAQAEVMADIIHIKLSETYKLTIKHDDQTDNTIGHRCTASIGVALFKGHDARPTDILRWADVAMYAAKESGRNLIRYYESKSKAVSHGLFAAHLLPPLSI